MRETITATLDASTLFPALPMSIMKIPPTIKIVTMLSTQDRSLRRIMKGMFDEIKGIHLTHRPLQQLTIFTYTSTVSHPTFLSSGGQTSLGTSDGKSCIPKKPDARM